jgi:hypothetical protein
VKPVSGLITSYHPSVFRTVRKGPINNVPQDALRPRAINALVSQHLTEQYLVCFLLSHIAASEKERVKVVHLLHISKRPNEMMATHSMTSDALCCRKSHPNWSHYVLLSSKVKNQAAEQRVEATLQPHPSTNILQVDRYTILCSSLPPSLALSSSLHRRAWPVRQICQWTTKYVVMDKVGIHPSYIQSINVMYVHLQFQFRMEAIRGKNGIDTLCHPRARYHGFYRPRGPQ